MAELWQILSQLAEWLLFKLYETTGSLGLAIIIFTVIVKIITYPLTKKQVKAMKEVQELQPHLKKMQEKYKKDPKELQRRMFEMYRQKGINPMSGCLPLLVQMPILILLYQAIIGIKNHFAAQGMLWLHNITNPSFAFPETGFLWVPTLLAPDMGLLILYGISMYITQRLTTPPNVDPQQEQTQRMMAVMMPFMFTFFFRTFPAAFILYWLMFNILTTVQQFMIMPELKERLKWGASKKKPAGKKA